MPLATGQEPFEVNSSSKTDRPNDKTDNSINAEKVQAITSSNDTRQLASYAEVRASCPSDADRDEKPTRAR